MLSGPEIRRQRDMGNIIIEPWNDDHCNPNSVDLTLAPTLLVYDEVILDVRKQARTRELVIPTGGLILYPGMLYLASTIEYTETHGFVPGINGKSSLGRKGLSIHVTAGFGDCGFCGVWCLEMTVVHALWVYPAMRICQIAYYELTGEPVAYTGRYQHQSGPTPSRAWQDYTQGAG